MVPEIWSVTERIFCHFGPFFALLLPYGSRKAKFWKNEKNTFYHFTNVRHKWQSYDICFSDMECNRQNFFAILDHFLPFYPPSPNNPKNQNFEKLKKNPGDIIILQKCTKNHDHMLYCSLDMTHNGFNYFSFWAIFYPFTLFLRYGAWQM